MIRWCPNRANGRRIDPRPMLAGNLSSRTSARLRARIEQAVGVAPVVRAQMHGALRNPKLVCRPSAMIAFGDAACIAGANRTCVEDVPRDLVKTTGKPRARYVPGV